MTKGNMNKPKTITKPDTTDPTAPQTNEAALISELRQRLAETEGKLEDALARLDDALKQDSEFVPDSEDPLLDLTQAGELVGRSHQTIRNMINQKMLRCVQEPGGLMRVRKSSLVKLYSESFLIDAEQRQRDEQAAERRRAEAIEREAPNSGIEIEKPPEGGDTYINPILLQLKQEREQSELTQPVE